MNTQRNLDKTANKMQPPNEGDESWTHIEFQIAGIAPLLMHNTNILIDRLSPASKRIAEINEKKLKRTDADFEEVAKLEFIASLYYDEDKRTGVYIPSENIEATIVNAAKTKRRGPTARVGMMCLNPKHPLIYDGPKTPEELYEDKRFVDKRSVVIAGKRIMRCRPIFFPWGLRFTLLIDKQIVNPRAVQEWVEIAGKMIGLCDYRPKYGRFKIA